MARSDALKGALPLLVLKVLARRGPMHGYAITTHIEGTAEGLRVEEGSLYPALHRLEEARLVTARWGVTANKRRARTYEITAAGRRQLAAEEQHWRTVALAVAHALDHILAPTGGRQHVLVVTPGQRRAIRIARSRSRGRAAVPHRVARRRARGARPVAHGRTGRGAPSVRQHARPPRGEPRRKAADVG